MYFFVESIFHVYKVITKNNTSLLNPGFLFSNSVKLFLICKISHFATVSVFPILQGIPNTKKH